MMTNSKNILSEILALLKSRQNSENINLCLIVLATDSYTAQIMVKLLSGKLS